MRHSGFDGSPMNFDMRRRVFDGHNMKIVACSWRFDDLSPAVVDPLPRLQPLPLRGGRLSV
jgi:hypothetical protein